MPDENDALLSAYYLLESSKAIRNVAPNLAALTTRDYAQLAQIATDLSGLSTRVASVEQRGRQSPGQQRVPSTQARLPSRRS